MAKSAKAKRKKISKAFLARFSQFVPDHNVPADYFNSDNFEWRMFPATRNIALRRVLSDSIRGHVATVEWQGQNTSLDRFLEYALIAIATFEYRRKRQAGFNRAAARRKIEKARKCIEQAREALQAIASSHQLSTFLEETYLTVAQLAQRVRELDNAGPNSRAEYEKSFVTEYNQALAWIDNYQAVGPVGTALRLSKLELTLAVAADKVGLGPGDVQKDEIAQQLCEDLAFAWICGTGTIPAVSKSGTGFKGQSPFVELLSVVNDVVEKPFQHRNAFRNYCSMARDKVRAAYPELVTRLRKKRGRK